MARAIIVQKDPKTKIVKTILELADGTLTCMNIHIAQLDGYRVAFASGKTAGQCLQNFESFFYPRRTDFFRSENHVLPTAHYN